LAIQELLGVAREPLAPVRPEDEPDARLVVPSPDRLEPPWSGAYEAGGVWAVLEPRAGSEGADFEVNGEAHHCSRPGAVLLFEHVRHTHGELSLVLPRSLRCDGVCFTPGLAGEAAS
ncbi:MAG TPA: DipZ protein, partial [Solirubrobacteraceae bacterium]|nr:DipZ protein [Solirubrobacteraceae bacterium]